MRRIRQAAALVLVLMALALPGAAAAKGEFYSCSALARDGMQIAGAGFLDKDEMRQFKLEYPAPTFKVTCVKFDFPT
jgi:hypothetical protein